MISSSRRWLQNARTLLSLAHQPLRCCSPSSTPSQQRLRRVLLWQSRRLEIDFEKMFDLVSISAREGKLGLEKNSRKTPHCPASINARDVSSRMAACLLVGRQRTASRTVGTSSSFACSVDAIRNQPLWSSSSSRMVAEAPCCEWPDAWWTGSEIAESVPSVSLTGRQTQPYCCPYYANLQEYTPKPVISAITAKCVQLDYPGHRSAGRRGGIIKTRGHHRPRLV